MEKKIKDMDFVEIMNLLDSKEFNSIKFEKVDKSFDSWDEFFSEYANGQEINKQWMGMHEFTFIWKGDDKYPFAYVFPKSKKEVGHTFYIAK